MKTRITYHKGYLACQYRTAGTRPLGTGSFYTTQSSIVLEPRFRLFESEEIPESEYPEEGSTLGRPYILQRGEEDVEFHFKGVSDPVLGTRRMRAIEVLLFPQPNGEPERTDEALAGTRQWEIFLQDRPDLSMEYAPFSARVEKDTCGRILSPAFVKAVEYLDDEDKPLPTEPVTGKRRRKCCLRRKRRIAPVTGEGGTFPPPGDRGGCLGVFGMAGSVGATPWLGLGGCLLPILLLALAALLWWLAGMRGCNAERTPATTVVRDTVYMEVERIDTLVIVKKDTVSYVDSTTTVTYESVNLPNVQFISSSDTLMPSSASDLQQLAEYLRGNDSLTATIIGHTDSLGNPQSNLRLSQQRAESVKRFLVSLGVDGNRLEALGMGDREPRADNRLEEGRLMNRRVEVKLTRNVVNTTKRTIVGGGGGPSLNDSTERR